MKNFIVVILSLMIVPSAATARDTRLKLPLSEALESAQAKAKLGDDIKLHFGNLKTPRINKKLGEIRTNKKTNAFAKKDETACKWVFLSAMIALQIEARRMGANAVINIKSNYKDKPFKSNEMYECGAGALLAGTAFIGTAVVTK